MSNQKRNKVTDMEFDEVSLVDKGANQHAHVAIAKRAPEEENMPELNIELFDEDGDLLDVEQLEDGQVVYDEAGNAYEFSLDAEAGGEEEVEEETAEADDREPELVGKALSDPFKAFAAAAKPKPQAPAIKKPKVAGAPAAQNAGGGSGMTAMKKSFSEAVMEELSKAMTDEDRDQVLSKALGRVEELLEENNQAVEIAKAERELRLTNEYIAKAADYNLPVDPAELGPVLYRMVEKMDYEDCAVIAKCLDAASNALFEEVGYIGGGDNADVLDQVSAIADERVSKLADTEVSKADAFLGVLDENPAAYDEYLATRRGL